MTCHKSPPPSDHTVKLTAVPGFQIKKSGNLTLHTLNFFEINMRIKYNLIFFYGIFSVFRLI